MNESRSSVNKSIYLVMIITLAILGGVVIFGGMDQKVNPVSTSTSPSSIPNVEKVNISASFKIVTGNITRSFVASKYHHQSPDVYIEASDPSVAHVTKSGIIWADFFNSLPMKLTKDCLTTGDGETLCDGQGGSLKFYLNDIEDKNLLDKEIKEGDKILVTFK